MTNKISDRVEAFRTAGEAIGLLFGSRAAELRAYSEGIREGEHAARKAAGQCCCPPECDDELDPGLEREAQQMVAETLYEQQNAGEPVVADEESPAPAFTDDPGSLYCGDCGSARAPFGKLEHTPGCPRLNPPQPGWAQVARRDIPEGAQP